MADAATDYLDPRQMGPMPDPVDMPGGQPTTVPPPKPMSDEDVQGFIKKKEDITAESVAKLRSLDKQRLDLASQPTPHPAQPKFQDIPKPPDTKPLNVFKEAQPALIFTTVMGALAMRNHGMGAMAAATGFLEGWQKGDQERMDRERQKWNDNVTAIKDENDVQKSRYDAVWNDTKLTQADKMAKISAIGASIGDQQTIAAMQGGNIDFAYKLQQDRNTAATKLWETNVRYGGGAGQISEEGLRIMVDQYLTGDKSVLQNIGRGAQGSQNIARFRNQLAETMKARDISGSDQAKKIQQFTADTAGLSSAERKIGSISGGLDVIMRNAYAAIPQALEASEKVPRGKFVPINQLIQTADAKLSDPNLISFKQANLQLAELWARAMNPQGVMRESDRDLALSILSTATSKEAYARVVENLKTFLEREQKSVTQAREGIPMTHDTLPAATAPEGWSIERVQ